MLNVVKIAIDRAGMNIRELSVLSGVPYTTVYEIVNGRRKPENVGVETFKKLAHAMGLTADELLALDDEPAVEIEEPTPEERELVSVFRSANKATQRTILNTAHAIADSMSSASMADFIDMQIEAEAAEDLRSRGYMD